MDCMFPTVPWLEEGSERPLRVQVRLTADAGV